MSKQAKNILVKQFKVSRRHPPRNTPRSLTYPHPGCPLTPHPLHLSLPSPSPTPGPDLESAE